MPRYADDGERDLWLKNKSLYNHCYKKKRKLWDGLYEATAAEYDGIEAWEIKAFFEAYLRWIRCFFFDFAGEVPLGLSYKEYKKVLHKISIPGLGMWDVPWYEYNGCHAIKHFYSKITRMRVEAGEKRTYEDRVLAKKQYDEYKKSKARVHGDNSECE